MNYLNNHKKFILNSGIFYLFLLFMATGFRAKAQEKTLVSIAHQNGSPISLTFKELKAIMLGEKDRWKSGSRIHVALMKTNTALGKQIAETVFDMNPDELNRHWLGLVFQGKAQAPSFFSTVADLEAYVSQNPGAIGISGRNPVSEDIKVIQIDGQKNLP
jgi:hypothetical protein